MIIQTQHADYRSFLEGKISLAAETGFAVDPAEINPALKPFNRDIVQWAAAGGRRGGGSELSTAYFADAVHYLRQAEMDHTAPTLFDALELEKGAAE